MSQTFEAHLAAGRQALEARDYDIAAPAFHAALAAAENGLERAMALLGLAQPDCYGENSAHALKLLNEAQACLPSGDPPEPRLADTYARICLMKANCVMSVREYRLGVHELDQAIDRFLDLASTPEPATSFARDLRETMIDVLRMKAGLVAPMSELDDWVACAHEEIACHDEVIRRFASVADPKITRYVAWAMLFRARKLPDAGRAAEEMSAYDEILARYGDRTEAPFVDVVTSALERQIQICGRSGNFAAALAAAEDLLRRSAGNTDWTIIFRARHARLSKAHALIDLERVDEGRMLCDQIIAEQSDTSISRAEAADALLIKADSYPDSDFVLAIACYDRVIADYGTDTNWSVVRQVGRAWHYKSQVLRDAGREAEAVACFTTMIALYRDHRDPTLKRLVEEARDMLAKGPTSTH